MRKLLLCVLTFTFLFANSALAFDVKLEGINVYKNSRCQKEMVLIRVFFSAENVDAGDLIYGELSRNEIVMKPVQNVDGRGFIVHGFCAPLGFKLPVKVRFLRLSDGELSNILAFTIDVHSANVITTSPPELTNLK